MHDLPPNSVSALFKKPFMSDFDTKTNWMRSLPIVAAIVVIICVQTACDIWNQDGRSTQLESRLTLSLENVKKNHIQAPINLNHLFQEAWTKACFQSPYAEKTQFENGIGAKVSSYEYIADDYYVLWVFYGDSRQIWAKVHRVEVMDRDLTIGQPCTTPSSPWLYVVNRNGKLQYHF